MDVFLPDSNTGVNKVAKKLKDIDLTGADDFKEEEEVVKPVKKRGGPPPVP
jgi:hypothetical protein